MVETTMCEVKNSVDDKPMTVVTVWKDDELKITVIRSEMTPLIAETTITEMYGCMKRKKTREEFWQEMKNDLSGETEGLKFSLREQRTTMLSWKKDMWMRGTIMMHQVDHISAPTSVNIEWITKYSILQKTTAKLEKENEILKKKMEQLMSTIKEMEKIKKCMEDSLYKQFLLLLNSKKRKIRELEEKLSNREFNDDRKVYDENTDVSEDEPDTLCTPEKRQKREKSPSPLASTSTNVIQNQSMFNSESDEEIVLRYDESQTEIVH